MFRFINLTPQTPPSVIHGWKATDLLYEMVRKEKYFFHPVKRQIFDDAPKQTFYMIWELVIKSNRKDVSAKKWWNRRRIVGLPGSKTTSLLTPAGRSSTIILVPWQFLAPWPVLRIQINFFFFGSSVDLWSIYCIGGNLSPPPAIFAHLLVSTPCNT